MKNCLHVINPVAEVLYQGSGQGGQMTMLHGNRGTNLLGLCQLFIARPRADLQDELEESTKGLEGLRIS